MKKTTLLMNVCLISGILLFNSCAKDGAVGPAGTNGAVGPTGPTGNANVHSQTITVNSWNWTHFGTQGQPGDGYQANILYPAITQEIIDKGMVMVYQISNNAAIPLPITIFSKAGSNYSRTFTYAIGVGEIDFAVFDSDFITIAPSSTMTFKVVVASGMKGKPNIDWNNYNEVKQMFSLPN
jgi:hypothetical protein